MHLPGQIYSFVVILLGNSLYWQVSFRLIDSNAFQMQMFKLLLFLLHSLFPGGKGSSSLLQGQNHSTGLHSVLLSHYGRDHLHLSNLAHIAEPQVEEKQNG